MSISRKVCCIRGCTHTSRQKNGIKSIVKFYKFPESTLGVSWKINKRKKWINAVKNYVRDSKDWEPNTFTKICSSHFLNNEKSEHPLHPSYIPTIFQKNDKSNVNKSIKPIQRIQKPQSKEASHNKELMVKERVVRRNRKYKFKCEMPNCESVKYNRRNQKNVKTFFKFPRQVNMYQKWADACQKLVKDLNTETRYVCGDHFTKEMLVSPYCRRLKSGAVPSANCATKENSEENIAQNKLIIRGEDDCNVRVELLQEGIHKRRKEELDEGVKEISDFTKIFVKPIDKINLQNENGTNSCLEDSINKQNIVAKDTIKDELNVTIKQEMDTGEFDAEQYNIVIVHVQEVKEEVVDIVECFAEEIVDLPEEQDIKLGEKLYKCNICSKAFNDNSTCSKHILTHELYQCGICNDKFVSSVELMLHLKGHKVSICDLCQMQFQSLAKLKEHKFVTCIYRECCELCLNDDQIRDYLLIIMEEHYKGIYSCDKCNIQVKTASQLLHHLASHYNSKCINCEIKAYNEETNQSINRSLFCFKCHSHFKTIQQQKKHMLTQHSQVKLYTCQYCSDVFKMKIELRNHINVHKNECVKRIAVEEEKRSVEMHQLDGEDMKVFMIKRC